ncbi:PDZ domain-containing protein GIPC1-like [Haliotis rufescens]|uniref:PDZ domain-containing protein GIPC1-like n=1 Tax=Haliotis rufescens TaxID=6454 RepID=UPI001EB0977F|nr:PDZ domain-containing protein GIPC1-like [Haliotis rufescens]
MPIFGKKNKSKENLTQNQQSPSDEAPRPAGSPETNGGGKVAKDNSPAQPQPRPKLVFHCQLAQGSPTGIIQGFTNVKELYQKIAECYEMPVSEILFCTLNTHKIDMTKLLGGQIGLDDFIFAHIKGRPKEMDVTKSEDALGLTITDNGAGYAFIKRIKEGSIMDRVPLITVGDHIEKLDGKSLVGCRHYEVAKMLKEIPKGTTFTLRAVQPEMSGFSHIGASSGGKKKADFGSGKQTLRLRANGPATVEEDDDVSSIAVDKINNLLESYMGINDTDLSQSIWDMGKTCDNPSTFAINVDESEFKEFGFTDDFIFDMWGAISDAKQGRLKAAAKEFNEQF